MGPARSGRHLAALGVVKRVAIIGAGGAGKSVLARELGARTGLPVIHLDRLYWRPGWTEPPKAEWQWVHEGLIAGERWIIDGNYGGTMEPRLRAADTVVYLDLPRLVCLWSVVRRRFSEGRRGRADIADRLQDKLEWAFLRWIWNYPAKRRPAILQLLASLPAATAVIQLRSRRAVREWLDRVATTAEAAA